MSSVFEGMLAQLQGKKVKFKRILGYWLLNLFITITIWLGVAWTVAKIFEETIAWGAVWVLFFHAIVSLATKTTARQVTR